MTALNRVPAVKDVVIYRKANGKLVRGHILSINGDGTVNLRLAGSRTVVNNVARFSTPVDLGKWGYVQVPTGYTFTPPTAITSFTPSAGLSGDTVTLTGVSFTGATSVKFNGIAAAYTVVNDTTITAVVPAGNVGGYIQVVSPAGTAISGQVFTSFAVLQSGLLKAAYQADRASAQTLVSDTFTRTASGPQTVVSDNFSRLPVVTDDFSEADGTSLNGKATDTSQTWSVLSGTHTISGGKTASSVAGIAVLETGLADVAIQGTVTTAGLNKVIIARCSDASNYVGFHAWAPTNPYYIIKTVAGSDTILTSGSTYTASPTVQARCIGSSLQMLVNGVLVASTSDTFNSTVTKHGIGGNSDVTVDNFSVTRADLGVANTGHNWSQTGGSWGINTTGKAYTITDGITSAWLDSGLADMDVTFVGAVKIYFEYMFRRIDDNNYWSVYPEVSASGGSGTFRLRKIVAGVATNVKAGTFSPNATTAVRVVAIGSLIQVYFDGVLQTALTSTGDSANSTGTGVGVKETSGPPSNFYLSSLSVSRPATGVLDDFSEADGTSLNGKATDTGQVWSLLTGAGSVQSGQAAFSGGTTGTLVLETGLADVAVAASLTSAATKQHFVFGRVSAANNSIAAGFDASSTVLRLYKQVGGAYTLLASNAAASRQATVTLRMIGTSLTATDGTVTISAADSAGQTNTQHGFFGDAGATFDNFSVTRADLGYATGINGVQLPWVDGPTRSGTGRHGINAAGQVFFTGTAAQSVAYVDTKTADIDLSVTLTVPSGGGQNTGVLFRYTDSNNLWYVQDYVGGINLHKVVAGVRTTLFGPVSNGGKLTYTVRIIAIGSTIKVYIDGVQVGGTQTDAFNATATKHGLYQDQSAPTQLFDNFSVSTPTLAAGDALSVLPDLSGNNNHAVQTTAANQPKYGFGTVSDTFSQADGTALNGKLTDTGQAWQILANAGTITSGRLVSGTFGVTAIVETGMSDATVSADIVSFASGDALMFRYVDGNNYLYAGITGGSLFITKVVGGSFTSVASGVSTFVAGDNLGIRFAGALLKLVKNGTVVGSVSDAANSTGSKHGIRSASAAQYDNFSVTSLAGGKAVASFDGTTLRRLVTPIASNIYSAMTVVAVTSQHAGAIHAIIGENGSGGSYELRHDSADKNNIVRRNQAGLLIGTASVSDNLPHVIVAVTDDVANLEWLFLDGARDGTAAVDPNFSTNTLTVGGEDGAGGTGYTEGDIEAVFVFQGILSYADRKLVETVLQARYATPALAA